MKRMEILRAAAISRLARLVEGPQGAAMRTQTAVVRSLVDELAHHPSPDPCGADLRMQVKEELVRLMRLMTGHRAVALAPQPEPPQMARAQGFP